MALSLDPAQNPILQVYELFSRPGLHPVDKAEYFGFKKLKLQALTSRRAQELVGLVRKTPDAVNHFRLMFDNEQLMDFASPVTEWLDRKTIEQLGGHLCSNCGEALASVRDDLDAYEGGASLVVADLEAEGLALLDQLADCRDCGGRFEFDVKLDKEVLVRAYLLDIPDTLNANEANAEIKEENPQKKPPDDSTTPYVSPLLWYDAESFGKAFDSFDSFLLFIRQAARTPIIVFLYQPVDVYSGDYFKIFSLTGGKATVSEREDKLREQLNAFTVQVLTDFELQRLKHSSELRSIERLDLPPSFFLQRRDVLAQYPTHPLFSDSPIRSVIVYAVLAWLAEKSWLDGAVGHFVLPPKSVSSEAVRFQFSLIDVQHNSESVFNTQSDWRAVLGLVVREIAQSAGNERLRKLWKEALADVSFEDLSSSEFFNSLESVCTDFVTVKQEPPLKATISAPEFIEILVFLDAQSKEIRFQLNSLSLGYVYEKVGHVPLGKGDPDLLAVELSKLAREHYNRVLVADVHNPGLLIPSARLLKAHGAQLWRKLIPDDLKRAYADLRNQENLTIFIVSDDPSFPWELVRPVEIDKKITNRIFKDMWWAVEFSIGRWLRDKRAPATSVVLNRICCVVTGADLPAAVRERDHLMKMGVVCDLPESHAELLKFLNTRDYDLIHFACHGEFRTEDPGDSVLAMRGGQLRPIDLWDDPMVERFNKNRPVIFLNSCHSGRTGPTLIGIEGWAERFIDLGCGAFIGCGWEVHDELAADFAITFYDAFKGNTTMGQAVKEARDKIRKQDEENSTWLAYYLYGNPNCGRR